MSYAIVSPIVMPHNHFLLKKSQDSFPLNFVFISAYLREWSLQNSHIQAALLGLPMTAAHLRSKVAGHNAGAKRCAHEQQIFYHPPLFPIISCKIIKGF